MENNNPKFQEEQKTVRVPVFFPFEGVGNSGNEGQIENAFLEVLETREAGQKRFRARKRPGLASHSSPTGATARRARGIYNWNNVIYTIYDDRIYADTTLIYTGVPNPDNEICGISASQPDSPNQYLVINAKTACYLIDTSNNVLVMNNVVISTSSVAASTTITTATAHGLATGNRVIIRGHTGSTPSINDAVYTVTVLTATTFTIPVTVTVAGTGGTLGVFPTNVGSLEFLNGYFIVGTTNGRIYNCTFNDPKEWPTGLYITAQMDSQNLVGITRQNNYLVILGETTTQFFVDASKSPGSPFENVEQAIKQYGCSSRQSISSNSDKVYWVGKTATGGLSIYMLEDGINIRKIGDESIDLLLADQLAIYTSSIVGCAVSFRSASFYIFLQIEGSFASGNAYAYNVTSDTWTVFNTEMTVNSQNVRFPITWTKAPASAIYRIVGQDILSGNVWYLSTEGKDGTPANVFTNVKVKILFPPLWFDTGKRKFYHRAEVLGKNWRRGTATPLYDCTVTLRTIDGDFWNPGNSTTTIFAGGAARTMTIAGDNGNVPDRFFWRNLGQGRRRRFGIEIDCPSEYLVIEALELDISVGVG